MASALKLGGGMVALLVALAVYAIIGALSMATTAFVVAGGAVLLGFTTLGTAQAIALWVLAIGAVLGLIVGLFQVAVLSASSGELSYH